MRAHGTQDCVRLQGVGRDMLYLRYLTVLGTTQLLLQHVPRVG